MKRLYFPLAALLAGFGLAFLAAGVSGLFFVFLPVIVFAFGYFSSWRWGLLYGFLLFGGYTFATALMWEVPYAFFGISQYIGAFVSGGFSICLIGALAPVAKQGIGKISSIAVLVALAAAVGWCTYVSIPNYRYTYQVMILSPEDTEIYLPVETTSNELASKLLGTAHVMSGSYGPDTYKAELAKTDYGQMWNIGIYGHPPDASQISRSSNWVRASDEIRSLQRFSLPNTIQLKPDSNEVTVNGVELQSPPSLLSSSKIIKEFTVPVKAISSTNVDYQIMLLTSFERIESINFGYLKTESYSERIEFKGKTNDDWGTMPVKAYHTLSIRGLGD